MILQSLVASSARQISAMALSVFLVKFTLRLRTSREGLIQFLTSKYYIIEQHDCIYMRYYIEIICKYMHFIYFIKQSSRWVKFDLTSCEKLATVLLIYLYTYHCANRHEYIIIYYICIWKILQPQFQKAHHIITFGTYYNINS